MPTQIAKLDFWSYLNYKSTSDLASLYSPNLTGEVIERMSSGKMTVTDGTFRGIMARREGTPTQANSGESNYLKGGFYYSSVYAPQFGVGGAPFVSASGLQDINTAGVSGVEIHFSDWEAAVRTRNSAYNFGSFAIDGKEYRLSFTTDEGLFLALSTALTANLLTYRSASTNFTNLTWRSARLRVFKSGTNLYVKINVQEGTNNITGSCLLSLSVPEATFTAIRTPHGYDQYSANGQRLDNISLYTISESEATTYATGWEVAPNIGTGKEAVNDLAPFQRYAPMLDLVPVFGSGWTTPSSSPSTPHSVLIDGDLTSFATTSTKDVPIGFIASDGVATATIEENEWYMVIAAGVGQNLSSVGGQNPAALNDIFLATSGATLAGNYVYKLLTFGDIQSRCYSWTPGTLTQLPSIGVIRSGGSMGFSIANTELETLTYRFGMVNANMNISAFLNVAQDVVTSGNPFGETLATNNFAETGIFNGHQFTTDQPVIFTLERKS
jgi:hypothetical protein